MAIYSVMIIPYLSINHCRLIEQYPHRQGKLNIILSESDLPKGQIYDGISDPTVQDRFANDKCMSSLSSGGS